MLCAHKMLCVHPLSLLLLLLLHLPHFPSLTRGAIRWAVARENFKRKIAFNETFAQFSMHHKFAGKFLQNNIFQWTNLELTSWRTLDVYSICMYVCMNVCVCIYIRWNSFVAHFVKKKKQNKDFSCASLPWKNVSAYSAARNCIYKYIIYVCT